MCSLLIRQSIDSLSNEFQLLALFTTKQQDNQLDIVASGHFKGFPLKKNTGEYALVFTEAAA